MMWLFGLALIVVIVLGVIHVWRVKPAGKRRLYAAAVLLSPILIMAIGGLIWLLAGPECAGGFKSTGRCELFGFYWDDFIGVTVWMFGYIEAIFFLPVVLVLLVWEGVARVQARFGQRD